MNPKRLMSIATLIELVGMIVLLGGAFWQAKIAGLWDQQLPEWQVYIQEDVNLAVLGSLDGIASIATVTDQELKNKLLLGVQKRVGDAIIKAIEERDRRQQAITNGQASTFWSIRDYLMLLGALLLVIGKGIAVKAAFTDAESATAG